MIKGRPKSVHIIHCAAHAANRGFRYKPREAQRTHRMMMTSSPDTPQPPPPPPHRVALALRPLKGQPLLADIHPPASAEQECPILQEPIASASIEFLQRPFDATRPTHTAVTLCQCQHTFHTMALIYFWARSGSVLCPVCRAGPQGQKLSIRNLPKEWKYTLAARIRRQRRMDQAEAENDDRQAAVELMASQQHQPILLTLRPMYLNICIEVLSQVNLRDLDAPYPQSWTVATNPVMDANTITFDVPNEELAYIPYPYGTYMRLVPRTNPLLQPLPPSRWFVAGEECLNDGRFRVTCDQTGFVRMDYSLSGPVYDEMVLDTFMAYDIMMTIQAR